MDINKKIKIILKEADLYHNQGLLNEAESKYREVLSLMQKHLGTAKDAQKIQKAIEKKILDLDKEKVRVEKKVLSPHMTETSQDLITQMFVAADGKESAEAKMEGAKALIKFGQFDRAIKELEVLLAEETVKLDAAKQIMASYMLNSKLDEIAPKIEKWFEEKTLSREQLESVVQHTRDLFITRGINMGLPDVADLGKKSKAPAEPVPESKDNLNLKKETFFFEEEFEEFDILASVKKSDKKGNKKTS